MAEPEEMEEDLFADLYDGDDAGAANAPNSSVPAEPNVVKHEAVEGPGYGEEPDTAGVPTSFDDMAGEGADDQGDMDFTHGTNGDSRPQSSAQGTGGHEPLQMKEDG